VVLETPGPMSVSALEFLAAQMGSVTGVIS